MKYYFDTSPFDLSMTPLVYLNKKVLQKEHFNETSIYKAQISISYIITMIIVILAISLSWQCHRKSCMSGRILHALFAGIFSFWYLIFYIIYRVILKNKCTYSN